VVSVFCISAATNGDIIFDKSFLLLHFFRLDFVVAVNVSGRNYLNTCVRCTLVLKITKYEL